MGRKVRNFLKLQIIINLIGMVGAIVLMWVRLQWPDTSVTYYVDSRISPEAQATETVYTFGVIAALFTTNIIISIMLMSFKNKMRGIGLCILFLSLMYGLLHIAKSDYAVWLLFLVIFDASYLHYLNRSNVKALFK